mmetsp:Transcript_4245/g.7791  ORF Transcript_4245/g.7791 Transcript_4245/m.7791 type:complete len:244 (+) Transcript_4245:222-953(+)
MPPLNRYFDGSTASPSPTGSCVSFESLRRDDVCFEFAHPSRTSPNSVSFGEADGIEDVQYLEHHCDWSEEERFSRWYSAEEYAIFRRDASNSLYLLRNCPEKLDGVTNTARGVECRNPAVLGRRQSVKQQAWNAVFEEQKACWNNPDNISVCIAMAYSQVSRPALLEALNMAATDELEVASYRLEESQKAAVEAGFADDWISSISSGEEYSSSSTEVGDGAEFGFCVFGDSSGFDENWLKGES